MYPMIKCYIAADLHASMREIHIVDSRILFHIRVEFSIDNKSFQYL